MKSLLFKTAGSFILVLALSVTAMAADLVGTYKCEGGSGDQKYTGTVDITKKGDTYILSWKIGDSSYMGLGILQDDILAVSFYGSLSGIVVYKVESDSKLVGKWAPTKGDGTLADETLTK